MQFLYHSSCKEDTIIVQDDAFKHLKARRAKIGDRLFFRNLKDGFLYLYEIISFSRKNAFLSLISKQKSSKNLEPFHIGWCIIEPKIIEKTLPMLNQLGVTKITFIYCQFSQRNFKISPQRLEKILISSCEQCGRDSLMQIDFSPNLKTFLEENSNSIIIDFKTDKFFQKRKNATFVIGAEGGFSDDERELFKEKEVFKFNTSLILKSETAVICACSSNLF